MESTHTSEIVGVRFSKVGKIYNFDARKLENYRIGDVVLVETSRGWQIGEIVTKVSNQEIVNEGNPVKVIDRLATPKDLLQRQSWQAKEPEVLTTSRRRGQELHLQGIKIIMCEYSYDGTRLTIFFSSESEDKIELKSLRGDMQKAFAPAQVEVKQIGPRDVAKFYGGMGACGLEKRCCCSFITEFSSISIRMAKEQGISLTPTEITGMCGRLRCCLIYEYENYVEARKLLPKRNKRVITPDGEGKVIDVHPLSQMIIVELAELGRREYHKDVIEPADELEALTNKAQNIDENKGNGGCANCDLK
jgi:cell fate regulator YaaT (PSP1 superfamily)